MNDNKHHLNRRLFITGVIAERKAAVLRVFDMFFALRSGLEKRKKRIMELVEGWYTGLG